MTMRTRARRPFDETERATSREYLSSVLPKYATVHVVQRHVSDSGMTRYLSLLAVDNGKIVDITWHAAAVLGDRAYDYRGNTWSLKVQGCGMDMHFHTVYRLAGALFGDSYALTHRTV